MAQQLVLASGTKASALSVTCTSSLVSLLPSLEICPLADKGLNKLQKASSTLGPISGP